MAGDAAYGTGLLIGRLRARGIERHVPVLDGERQKAKRLFGRADLAFDPARHVHVRPAGRDTLTTGHVVPATLLPPYGVSPASCGPRTLKPRCTAGPARMVTRNVQENERALAGTPEFKRSARERRKAEMLFAHLKRIGGFRRLRSRGLTGASDELLLAATAQDPRRLAHSVLVSPPPSAPAPA